MGPSFFLKHVHICDATLNWEVTPIHNDLSVGTLHTLGSAPVTGMCDPVWFEDCERVSSVANYGHYLPRQGIFTTVSIHKC